MKACSSAASTSSEGSKKEEDKDSGICSLYCLASCLTPTTPPLDSAENAEIFNLVNGSSNTEPFLRRSLFSNVPYTINFYTKGHKVMKPSVLYLPSLTWCHNSLLPVVMRQCLAVSHFKVVDESKLWIGYWGRHLKSAQYRRIKPYQKVNHFPGAFHLGRKDRLWQHLSEFMNEHTNNDYSIMPYTYVLPKDVKRLKAYLAFPAIRHVIVKPPASARGTGIKIVSRFKQIPTKTPLVAQHYIENPFLINGSKFDLRVYVYVTCLEPLRIYVYDEGLVRFASVPYSSSLASYSNQYMHLTNYSINRFSQENGMADKPVEKWTLAEFWDHITRQGYDANALKRDIHAVAAKAFIACEHHIRAHQKNYSDYPFVSHELFGMDVLVDSTLRPWLLEMNISPSLQSSTPVDIDVKAQLACDVLNMCGIPFPIRHDDFEDSMNYRVKPHFRHSSVEHLRKEAEHMQFFEKNRKIHSDILSTLTDVDVRYLIDFEDELSRRGKFTLVYPLGAETEKYLENMCSPVYANLLLHAWQKFQAASADRRRGIILLEHLCAENVHVAKPLSLSSDEQEDENSGNDDAETEEDKEEDAVDIDSACAE